MSEHAEDEAQRRERFLRMMGLICGGWAAALAESLCGKSSTAAAPLHPPKSGVWTAGNGSDSRADSAGQLQAEEHG